MRRSVPASLVVALGLNSRPSQDLVCAPIFLNDDVFDREGSFVCSLSQRAFRRPCAVQAAGLLPWHLIENNSTTPPAGLEASCATFLAGAGAGRGAYSDLD